MSRVLPNAMVVRAFRNLGLPEDRLPKDIEEIINQGLQKLYGFQHEDGSWGWWYDDDSSLYQTAYVIYGLAMTEQAGYLVDEEVLARGTSAARALLAQATDPRTRAYALYVLSVAGQGDLAAAQDLLGDKDQLDAFSQAALALALFQEGDDDGANELIDDLVAAAVETSSTAHWPQSDVDGTYRRKAMASTTRATALVLESLTHIRPGSPLLPKAARWLMDRRVGGHWRTTQETAYAILALADYIQVSGELQPDYSYEVYLNDELLSSGAITAANSLDPIPTIVAPSDLLAYGDNHVRLIKRGTGQLYYALTLRASHLSDGFVPVQPAGSGIIVTRQYQRAGDGYTASQSGSDFNVGDLIEVHLSVEATDDAWYVIIDDPLLAGCEALNERLNTTSHTPGTGRVPFTWRTYGYNRKDVHDERVTLFVTHLTAGRHEYDYLVRATTPGEFSALPTEISLMYDPDTWARSASLRCRISVEEVTLPAWISGDFDRDCRVTDFDLRQVVVPWNTRAGEPGYDAARDMDRDGDMDVVDVVRVAANWGSVCSPHDPWLFTLKALDPSLRVEPMGLTVTPGVAYTVAVTLDEPTDVDGYQFSLRFDPTVVQVSDVAMTPGYGTLGPHVDEAAGLVTCGAFRYGRGGTLSEDTSLAHVTFIGLQDGTTDFALEAIQFMQVGPPTRFFLPLILRRAD
jgi:hypothetical protein